MYKQLLLTAVLSGKTLQSENAFHLAGPSDPTEDSSDLGYIKRNCVPRNPGFDLLVQKEAPAHVSCAHVLLKETPADKMEVLLDLH